MPSSLNGSSRTGRHVVLRRVVLYPGTRYGTRASSAAGSAVRGGMGGTRLRLSDSTDLRLSRVVSGSALSIDPTLAGTHVRYRQPVRTVPRVRFNRFNVLRLVRYSLCVVFSVFQYTSALDCTAVLDLVQ